MVTLLLLIPEKVNSFFLRKILCDVTFAVYYLFRFPLFILKK